MVTITPATQTTQPPGLDNRVSEKTPPKDLINSMQQKIRDSLSLEGSQLSALHDTTSKVALPVKSSKLPARKKSSSVSITGESSEVDLDEEEEEAKRSRKERKAKSSSGR